VVGGGKAAEISSAFPLEPKHMTVPCASICATQDVVDGQLPRIILRSMRRSIRHRDDFVAHDLLVLIKPLFTLHG